MKHFIPSHRSLWKASPLNGELKVLELHLCERIEQRLLVDYSGWLKVSGVTLQQNYV